MKTVNIDDLLLFRLLLWSCLSWKINNLSSKQSIKVHTTVWRIMIAYQVLDREYFNFDIRLIFLLFCLMIICWNIYGCGNTGTLTPWHTCECWIIFRSVQFSLVQSLSRVQLFVIPWIAARQASQSITNTRSLLKLMSIESVMPSSHLIFYRPLLLLPPIPPSIRVFSNESTLHMRWPEYWRFSFSISPSNEHPGLISFRMDWLDLLAV